MARYIDADALKQRLLVGSELDPEPCKGFRSALLAMVDTQEDADVVKVVRCRKCKHSHAWYADRRTCELWSETGVSVFNDGYCSYGERREDAETQ